MNKFVFSLALLLLFQIGLVHAQSYTLDIPDPATKTIEIQLSSGTLSIQGSKENQLKLYSNFEQGQYPERAAGLKPLRPNMATDNTGFGIDVTQVKSSYVIKEATSQKLDIQLVLPQKVRLVISPVGWQAGNISAMEMSGEIEISSNNSNVQLFNVSGPVVVNAIDGDIEVVFKDINPDKPSAISNISGFIDVTLPEKAAANLQMVNLNGETFTDLDLDIVEEKFFGPGNIWGMRTPAPPAPPTPPTPPVLTDSKGNTLVGGANPYIKPEKPEKPEKPAKIAPPVAKGQGIRGKLNGGGVEISLHSINGDIYLRKGR
jgi:hypothetical protein